MENLFLGIVVVLLLIVFVACRKARTTLVHLKDIIEVMEKSDKVIKDCVVYGKLPLNASGEYLLFIDCTFENLDRTWQDARLLEILGN